MDIKETIVNECLNVLHRDDVKDEFKNLMKPLIDMLIKEIYPYIFLSIIFVFISFLLILGIFILLLRNKMLFYKKHNYLWYIYNMARRTRRRSRKARRSRKRRGGSVVGALRTALLPFLLYKGQKAMQKKVSRRKSKTCRRRRRR